MTPREQRPADEGLRSADERVRMPQGDVSPYAFRDPPASLTEQLPVTPLRPPAAQKRVRRKSDWADVRALMGCNLLVFVGSLCIMVLELTAARLIAKHVGNSLYTWTSVIGVVLAGITVGNYLGGWIADRFTPKKALPHLFLMSSVLSFGVLWMDGIAGSIDRPVSMAWSTWVLVMVAMVFLLPSISLGTISPVVASLALSRNTQTGITVGNVYAWGAMGSIAGTFLTGFWLIDMFGTRAIVAMTAATLACMGILVAAGQWAFRAAVALGWLQFVGVLGLAASIRADVLGDFLEKSPPNDRGRAANPAWRDTLLEVSGGLHRIGLALGLRNDVEEIYCDESNYSYIEVGDSFEDSERVRYLRLDKLMHSYYNPAEPTKLHYQYEEVYAEVTERVAEVKTHLTVVPLPDFDARNEILADLPDNVVFDDEAETLSVQGSLSPLEYEELLKLAPEGEYWLAVDELQRLSSAPGAAGLQSISLETWPAGVEIPEDLRDVVVFDPGLSLLNAYAPLDDHDRNRLAEAAVNVKYFKAVDGLYRESRQIDTLFLGGGGFVFPRWIESYFPHDPTIDVAEIDPAVVETGRLQLGLGDAGETAVRPFVADARRFVDERLQANAGLRYRQEPQRLYDFIYGDAFNDFSVPWHLTTIEFISKLQQLLKSDGVYLANIIDIYPRIEFPAARRGTAEVEFRGVLPEGLVDGAVFANEPARGVAPFESLEFVSEGPRVYRLRYHGVMSDEVMIALDEFAGAHEAFREATGELYDLTNERLPFDGTLPEALQPRSQVAERWLTAEEPFAFVEVRRLADGGVSLGVRGALSPSAADALRQLEPTNTAFIAAVDEMYAESRANRRGRFLGRTVKTLAEVFPNIYVYSTEPYGPPNGERDTFVIASSQQPLELRDKERSAGHWEGAPFAWAETSADGKLVLFGHMEALLELSDHLILEDDFAPVDNLLAPVFESQD